MIDERTDNLFNIILLIGLGILVVALIYLFLDIQKTIIIDQSINQSINQSENQ